MRDSGCVRDADSSCIVHVGNVHIITLAVHIRHSNASDLATFSVALVSNSCVVVMLISLGMSVLSVVMIVTSSAMRHARFPMGSTQCEASDFIRHDEQGIYDDYVD